VGAKMVITHPLRIGCLQYLIPNEPPIKFHEFIIALKYKSPHVTLGLILDHHRFDG
jgi:hypothetical protein